MPENEHQVEIRVLNQAQVRKNLILGFGNDVAFPHHCLALDAHLGLDEIPGPLAVQFGGFFVDEHIGAQGGPGHCHGGGYQVGVVPLRHQIPGNFGKGGALLALG